MARCRSAQPCARCQCVHAVVNPSRRSFVPASTRVCNGSLSTHAIMQACKRMPAHAYTGPRHESCSVSVQQTRPVLISPCTHHPRPSLACLPAARSAALARRLGPASTQSQHPYSNSPKAPCPQEAPDNHRPPKAPPPQPAAKPEPASDPPPPPPPAGTPSQPPSNRPGRDSLPQAQTRPQAQPQPPSAAFQPSVPPPKPPAKPPQPRPPPSIPLPPANPRWASDLVSTVCWDGLSGRHMMLSDPGQHGLSAAGADLDLAARLSMSMSMHACLTQHACSSDVNSMPAPLKGASTPRMSCWHGLCMHAFLAVQQDHGRAPLLALAAIHASHTRAC